MGSRLELHKELLLFTRNLYFQPPSNIQLEYPCIIYHKGRISRSYGNNGIYLRRQQYTLTVIDRDPDSTTADSIEEVFEYCEVSDHYTKDNLNHTTLTLYY